MAGAAGLLKDLHPRLNPRQVTSILKETAEDLGDRQQFGHGMLDVYGAVTLEFDDWRSGEGVTIPLGRHRFQPRSRVPLPVSWL